MVRDALEPGHDIVITANGYHADCDFGLESRPGTFYQFWNLVEQCFAEHFGALMGKWFRGSLHS